jgi:hypothetical protein
VGVGIAGRKDIVAVKTLLNAAGIPSLDVVAGTDNDLSNETMRFAGNIIVINIEYSNFFADTGACPCGGCGGGGGVWGWMGCRGTYAPARALRASRSNERRA